MLDKERDSAFCCPNIACGNCAVHGSRPALPDKIELLQRVWKNFSSVLDVGQKTLHLLFFFFWLKVNRSTLTGGPYRCVGLPKPYKAYNVGKIHVYII